MHTERKFGLLLWKMELHIFMSSPQFQCRLNWQDDQLTLAYTKRLTLMVIKVTPSQLDSQMIKAGKWFLCRFKLFQCWGYFRPKHKDAKIFENHLNPVKLVFIGKPLLSTLRWVPMCQGFNHFSGFSHTFVKTKVATSSMRVYSLIHIAVR